MSEQGDEARRFTRRQHNGVLSTLSRRLEGHPFGSVAPFVLDAAGCPVLLISDIAEHTKNIVADPRVSLIVQPFSPDMQETARVTLLGRAEHVPDKAGIGPRYLRYFPQAETYFAMHDFQFYRIVPERVRYIGGFGKIFWIEPEAWRTDVGTLPEAETGILEHMNTDHADTLRAYCRHWFELTPESATLIGIDPDGIDLRVTHDETTTVRRIDFDAPVRSAAEARTRLVEMARRGKA